MDKDVEEVIEIDEELIEPLNRLAWQFYKMQGYQAKEGFDFMASKHPMEKLMFAFAYTAFEFFQDEGLP